MMDTGVQSSVLEAVLLVDDNPVNLQILYKSLQNSGYRLLIANDGETAIEIARKVKPSLILLDIMMPGIDGFEVCETLKRDEDTENIAVIFLSALEDISAKVKGFSVGGVDYISKPFQVDEVVARVRNHIKIHRLERALARRNSELESENQQILNAISEGIVGLDREGRVMMLNSSATALTGWSAADCLGEKLTSLGLFSLGHAGAQESQTLPYRSYSLGMACYSEMEYIYRRDKRQQAVAISCTPRAEGGAVMVLRDVSEWMESEEALRRAREEIETARQNMAHMERLSTMGEMAAGIAHEVNQPLTAIVNYARVAHRLALEEIMDVGKLTSLLDKLVTQTVRASDVIQRVRRFVKKPDLDCGEYDPNVLMGDVVALAEVDSRVNDVAVHFEPQQGLPALRIDPVQAQQVALNLIRNAIEASANTANSQHGVLVTTALVGDQVRFSIMDRGVGVDEETAEKLFDPFFTTKPNGMGIGLTICQSIIQVYGGKIGYSPNKGGGATFYFSLPAA